ncbi:MAG TPA: hypothetical protein VGJ91_10865, partial [Polyangiaceae bacterium]
MPRSVGVAVGIGALFLTGWNSVACSSSSSGSHPGPILSDAGAATTAGSGNASSGGDGPLNLGMSGSGNGSSTGPDLSDACAAKISTAQAIPLDMYIMLDQSGSMLDPIAGGGDKWQAVTSALSDFVQQPEAEGIGVGLQYFGQPPHASWCPPTCMTDLDCASCGSNCVAASWWLP